MHGEKKMNMERGVPFYEVRVWNVITPLFGFWLTGTESMPRCVGFVDGFGVTFHPTFSADRWSGSILASFYRV